MLTFLFFIFIQCDVAMRPPAPPASPSGHGSCYGRLCRIITIRKTARSRLFSFARRYATLWCMKTLSIGIVGLPNVGKSTLFKLLTKQDITIANYPFATIDPNVGIVTVPDERVEKLTTLSKSKKKIPAVVEFYDIAGLVKGANKGEGLGNQFLSHIRETQAIVIVLRVFQNPDIIHVENSVDAVRDLDIILSELILKDLESVEKRFAKAEAEARTGKKEAIADRDEVVRVKAYLESGMPLSASPELFVLARVSRAVRELNLLTAKRQIYLLNGEEKDAPPALLAKIKELGADWLVADFAMAELAGTESESAADNESAAAVIMLVKKAYQVLGLISFFTTGEDETRAWTIERGTLAPQASGVIHTDFESKFIRLEVVPCDKLLEAGGWAAAKQKGWIRVEGKEYEVNDGDVVVVRHG
jgi:GTP-binding protein YchF